MKINESVILNKGHLMEPKNLGYNVSHTTFKSATRLLSGQVSSQLLCSESSYSAEENVCVLRNRK
jgi:hypothetical protein